MAQLDGALSLLALKLNYLSDIMTGSYRHTSPCERFTGFRRHGRLGTAVP